MSYLSFRFKSVICRFLLRTLSFIAVSRLWKFEADLYGLIPAMSGFFLEGVLSRGFDGELDPRLFDFEVFLGLSY